MESGHLKCELGWLSLMQAIMYSDLLVHGQIQDNLRGGAKPSNVSLN